MIPDVKPITVDTLRRFIFSVGEDAMTMTLVQVDGGYELRSYTAHQNGKVAKGFVLVSEKSSRRRVFKSPSAAFRICKTLGFKRVVVDL